MDIKKKIMNWRVFLGVFLVALSAGLYYIHFSLFHDTHHIFVYLWGDIAFVPIEVLMVTLIIHHLLEKRSKKAMLNKMNILIGAFFSDVGTGLLRSFAEMDPDIAELREKLELKSEWNDKDFVKMAMVLKGHEYGTKAVGSDFKAIKSFLSEKKVFLLNLLANPNILEHESFTELLWAVFHLAEEVENRADFTDMPDPDRNHLAGDVNRAYQALALQWIDYMYHLKKEYPYLFSLALRTNPFSLGTAAVITQ